MTHQALKLASDLLTSELRALSRASAPGKQRLQRTLMRIHLDHGVKQWPTTSGPAAVVDPRDIQVLGDRRVTAAAFGAALVNGMDNQ